MEIREEIQLREGEAPAKEIKAGKRGGTGEIQSEREIEEE